MRRLTALVASGSGPRPGDRFHDRPGDRFHDRPGDRFHDRPGDRFHDRPGDRLHDRRSGRSPAAWRPGARPGAARDGASVIAGLASVAAALRAGAPTGAAWRRGLGVDARDGVPERSALLERCGSDPDLAGVVHAAAALAAETGAPLAGVLDRVGAGLAEDVEAADRRAAALAGPRASARLLAWLPAVGMGLGFALGADPVGVLVDGHLGTGLLAAGALLTALGVRWTRRLVASAARTQED